MIDRWRWQRVEWSGTEGTDGAWEQWFVARDFLPFFLKPLTWSLSGCDPWFRCSSRQIWASLRVGPRCRRPPLGRGAEGVGQNSASSLLSRREMMSLALW